MAVDGGANYCRKLRIKPNIIIGDMDSISKKTKKYFSKIKTIKIIDQETTDLEKALKYLKKLKNITNINIFCAASLNRVDHFLSNIYSCGNNTQIIDKNFIIKFIDHNIMLKNLKNKTVSMFPVEHCTSLKLIGFQWPMNHKKYSISNIIKHDPAYIKIKKGKLILIINK